MEQLLVPSIEVRNFPAAVTRPLYLVSFLDGFFFFPLISNKAEMNVCGNCRKEVAV